MPKLFWVREFNGVEYLCFGVDSEVAVTARGRKNWILEGIGVSLKAISRDGNFTWPFVFN